MSEASDFKANIGLVHLQAKRGFAWAQQAGTPLTYDDMFQEASMAFVVAHRGYDPESGFKFSAYFSRAAHSHFSKAIGRFTGVKRLNEEMKAEVAERDEENARRRAAALPELPSVQYAVRAANFSDIGAARDDEDSEAFEQSLMSDSQSPEEIVETKQLMDRAMAQLSPLAALIVDWLRDPPPELVAELQSQHAHSFIADEQGVHARAMKEGISINSVKKFMELIGGATKREMMLAEAELRRAVTKIEEAA